jgi:REP element-mobilizing transposase RayT
MILATHAIFSAYGFWLPNDPRGSWSKFVASWDLLKFGKATTVTTRRSVAHIQHDVDRRRAAKMELRYSPVRFSGVQALSIARGFSTAIRDGGYVVHACCILPDHVHLVVRDDVRPVRRIIGHLKADATRQLHADGIYTFPSSAPWGRNCWAVYLRSAEDIRRAIRYIENNPLKEGKRKQVWSFVRPFAE